MGITIRPCRVGDLQAMRTVCAVCDDPAHPERLAWVLPMYCDFYVACCRDTCFVAADETDTAVGYILCAPDDRAYREAFVQSGTLRTVCAASPCMAFAWRMRPAAEWTVKRKPYTAHLHIDILPAYRQQGVGRKLMETLFETLKTRGVPGVMLGCARKNRNAQRFYERMGFLKLGMLPGAVYYGMRL